MSFLLVPSVEDGILVFSVLTHCLSCLKTGEGPLLDKDVSLVLEVLPALLTL